MHEPQSVCAIHGLFSPIYKKIQIL